MWTNFILVFVTFHVLSATSLDRIRKKRDLIRIKDFFTSLLGLPLSQNDEDHQIYGKPELYIQTLPDEALDRYNEKTSSYIGYKGNLHAAVYRNGNIDQQYMYPYREVETKRISYPVMEQRDTFETPILPNIRRINTYKDIMLPHQPNNEIKPERCITAESCVTIESTQSLLHSPLFVQNQVHQILPRPIWQSASSEIDLSRSQFTIPNEEVNIYKYPFQPLPINEREITKVQPLKISESFEMQPKQYETVTVNNQQISEAVNLNMIKPNIVSDNTNGMVTFSKPVPSRYVYKQIYHSDPSKNSAVIMDNELNISNKMLEVGETMKQKSELQPIVKNQINQPLDSDKVEDYPPIPPNYMFIPPESIVDRLAGTPLESKNNVTNSFKADSTAGGSEMSSFKTKPIVVFDEAQNNNIRRVGTKMRVIKRLKSKLPVPDNTRGDIPES